MLKRHEIDLRNLDCNTLTPELWSMIKNDAVRRAHDERKQAMSEFLGTLVAWGRKAANPTTRVLGAHRA